MLASYIIHVWEDDKKSSIVKNRLFRNMRDGPAISKGSYTILTD